MHGRLSQPDSTRYSPSERLLCQGVNSVGIASSGCNHTLLAPVVPRIDLVVVGCTEPLPFESKLQRLIPKPGKEVVRAEHLQGVDRLPAELSFAPIPDDPPNEFPTIPHPAHPEPRRANHQRPPRISLICQVAYSCVE